MQVYFAETIDGDTVILDREESHHAIHVMRLKSGSHIYITDGLGSMFNAEIQIADAKNCQVAVGDKVDIPSRNYFLHIAVAPTKNIDRFEWFLEKATEIGIDKITPLISTKSERRNINPDRLNKLIISAAKQSVKAAFPVLQPMIDLKSFLKLDQEDVKLIAHCNESNLPLIKSVYNKGKSVVVMIGPEGDFDNKEVESALSAGYKGISLGDSRLRTETAALVACNNISFLNQ